MEDMTITEYNKEDVKVYSLKRLLKEWNGIDNVSLTLKLDDQIPALSEE